MIFVTVGSSQYPFDRLMRAVGTLDGEEPIVVQTGPSKAYTGDGKTYEFMSFAELRENVEQARLVITHAGVGSMILAAAHGHTPIVVPRLARFGEAVDDHQADLAKELGQGGQVILAEDLDDLGTLLAAVPPRQATSSGAGSRLVERVAGDARQAFARDGDSRR